MNKVFGLLISFTLSGGINPIAFLCHESGGEDVDVHDDRPAVCAGLLTFRGELEGEAGIG